VESSRIPRDTIPTQRSQANRQIHSDNILSQIAALRDVGNHRKKIIHVESTGPHVIKCVAEDMDHDSLKRAPDHPYSPDLAPSGFCLFGYVKHRLQEHEFTEEAELVSVISGILNQFPTNTLVDVSDDWMRRLQSCIDISGEYVEQRLFFSIYGFPQITHSGHATIRVEHRVIGTPNECTICCWTGNDSLR
jgi:hypothetical protein